jgi:hypothetical protein
MKQKITEKLIESLQGNPLRPGHDPAPLCNSIYATQEKFSV